MAETEYGDISQRTAAWAAKEMLKHAEPVEVLQKLGLSKPIPANTAKGAKFRRPVPFAAATTALTEGVTPSAQAMTYEDVEVTLAQYGAVADTTDVVADMAEDPVLKDMSMLSGEQASLTLEMVLYGVLKAGTNVFYGNAVANRAAVITAPSLEDQRRVMRSLKAQKAKKITRLVAPGPNYNTEPIAPSYIGVAHTDLESDIRDMTNFVPVEKYAQSGASLPYEIGKVEEVRYLCSPELDAWADAGGGNAALFGTTDSAAHIDVYPIMYFGAEAFGNCVLRGKSAIKPIVLQPGTPSKSDPLGQKGYVGWKTYFAGVILNQAWMARLEVGRTA